MIEKDEIRELPTHHLESPLAVLRRQHPVAVDLEIQAMDTEQLELIVDQENRPHTANPAGWSCGDGMNDVPGQPERCHVAATRCKVAAGVRRQPYAARP